MNALISNKRSGSSYRVIFLLIVFLVLSISILVFKNIYGEIDRTGSGFQNKALLFYFTLPQIIGWLFFLTAIVFFLFDHKRQRISQYPIIFGLTAIMVATSYSAVFSSDLILSIWLASVFLISITFLFHFLSVLTDSYMIQQVKFAVLILSGFIVIGTVVLGLQLGQPFLSFLEQMIVFWSGILMGFALIMILAYFLGDGTIDQKNDRSVIGFVLSWLPFSVFLFQFAFDQGSPITPWIFLPIALYPIFIGNLVKGERIKKKNRFDESYRGETVRMLILYSLVGFIILSANLINRSTNQEFLNPPVYIGILLFFAPIIFMMFLKGNQRESETKNSFSSENNKTVKKTYKEINNLDDDLSKCEHYLQLKLKISDYLKSGQYHHFIVDPASQEFYAIALNTEKTSDLQFSGDSNLVQYLTKIKAPIIMNDFNHLPPELIIEKEKLELLNANCIFPIFLENHLNGWLAFSIENPQLGEIEHFISEITPVIGQFSKSLENAHHQKNLEQRLGDLDILTRVVQGVNYTLALDDIYELIYAQTTQAIPVDDFYIILKDHLTRTLSYVFFVEMDERIAENENQLVISEKTIEAQVIETGLGLIINNYADECVSLNFPQLYAEIKAAIFVPLNTGAITNGCIILGQRDLKKPFTESQLALAQSIADLVAGAIEKARLLEETEQYARQLAILNDLTRKLTSTLEIEEVFSTILQNSVEMVNCEEARLIIVDEKNQKFVYQAVSGIKSKDLDRRKVPLDFGLIGKSYLKKNQILFNRTGAQQDVLDDINSFYETSVTSLLIIPMISKNQVLGLIELVNRIDGTAFTNKDQDLLTALAAQAAIALENARLYRRTDQELAKRVEELSVMQRIDRELNASLDMRKAMDLTLTWALRQSGCEAGWVGLISESRLSLIVSSGYNSNQQNQLEQKTAFLDDWGPGKQNKSFVPVQIEVNKESQVHPMAISQILLPIQREENMIAIMVLENFTHRKLDKNEINFLIRLCEHASIAIVNSQLYTQVQEANKAKSEFVSLVAHELKNPMTSIKGYTELLATGAVGSITPAQGNFLATIRNNTDRMNTLVSDLNDLTKIEAGSMRMEPGELDLHEIINEVVRSTSGQFEEKQQVLHLKIEDRLPEVWADSSRLMQILINLINNAHKYTPVKGEILIIAEQANENGKVDPMGNFIHLQVSDNGFGISEKDQQMIFQKFFRSEDDDVRTSPGTGLGLNITRSLVEMQGGKIWFESEFKKGTSFHFTIPLADSKNN